MDFAAAEERHEAIADLFYPESRFDQVRVVGSHTNGIFVPEKIRSMEHKDVQGVTLDPLAAIDQASESA